MKLSDAILLGSTFVEMLPGCWDKCALGAAAQAVGIRPHHEDICAYWPWLAVDDCGPMCTIAAWFDDRVCNGKMTMDQLIKAVRQEEPACGECNTRKCCCRSVVVGDVAECRLERPDLAVAVVG